MKLKARSVFASFLLVVFVAGAWGNVLAALCPRMGSVRACCRMLKSHPSPSAETHDMHHMHVMEMAQMADTQMGETTMDMSSESTDGGLTQRQIESVIEADQDAEARAVDQPIKTCSHCLSHSQLPLGFVTLRETESAKRSADLTAAPQVIEQVSLTALPSLIIDQREHAPPGDPSPRHILINVFRI